jgi:hypothetical protein
MPLSKMSLDLTNEDGIVTIHLHSTDTREAITTTIADTDHGMDIKTVVTEGDGSEHTITDKTDRNTPPLEMMVDILHSYHNSFLHNAQAAMNHNRYQRLKARGEPITMYDMCMDGQHKTEQYKNILFEGGIVGVPTASQPEPEQHVELNETLESEIRAMFGIGDQDDEEGEAA